jgi:ribonuclease BN (tRNA processing enzyme)
MRYNLKALTTNNRDLCTALLFQIQHTREQTYLFSCPDGFQRIANYQKLKFGKVKVVFVPSLHPDHFGGFPGFFLSSRESKNDTEGESKRTLLICP